MPLPTAASTACSFRNGVERIETADDSDIKDRLYIHLVFFIVTGCLGDPARAIEYTESFVSDQMLSTLGTVETTVTSFFSAAARLREIFAWACCALWATRRVRRCAPYPWIRRAALSDR